MTSKRVFIFHKTKEIKDSEGVAIVLPLTIAELLIIASKHLNIKATDVYNSKNQLQNSIDSISHDDKLFIAGDLICPPINIAKGCIPWPGPAPRPFIGNLLDVISISEGVTKLTQRHSFFKLKLGGLDYYVINDAESALDVLSDKRFIKGESFPLKLRSAFPEFVFVSDWEIWEMVNKAMLPLFQTNYLKKSVPDFVSICNDLLTHWEKMNTQIVNIADISRHIALDSACKTALGVDFGACREEVDGISLGHALHVFHVENSKAITDEFIRKPKIFINNTKYKHSVQSIYEFVDKILDIHTKNPDKQNSNDVLSFLLQLSTKNPKFTTELLRQQCAGLLFAGHDTTASALAWTLFEIFQHPEIELKILDEIKSIVGSRAPVFEDIKKMTYIEKVVWESLRLHPIVPIINRQTVEDLVVGPHFIPKNSMVFIASYGIQHNVKLWNNPEEFNPDRFGDKFTEDSVAKKLIPFSYGFRQCLGKYAALYEIRTVIVILLRKFHFSFPKDIKFQLQWRPPTNLDVFLVPRDAAFSILSMELVDLQLSNRIGEILEKQKKRPVSRALIYEGSDILILYGSGNGRGEEFAKETYDEMSQIGINAQIQDMSSFIPENILKKKVVIVLVSTYNGNPPAAAQALIEYLASQTDKKILSAIKYTVFGLGNSQWKNSYQKIPKLFNSLLQGLGATTIASCGYGDANKNIEGDIITWRGQLLVELSGLVKLSEPSKEEEFNFVVEFIPEPKRKVIGLQRIVTMASLIQIKSAFVHNIEEVAVDTNDPLFSVKRVEFLIGSSYCTGDYIGILAENSPALCETLAKRLNVNLNQWFEFKPRDSSKDAPYNSRFPSLTTVREVLRTGVDVLGLPSHSELRHLSRYATDSKEIEKLELLYSTTEEGISEYNRYINQERRTTLDILMEMTSINIPFSHFIQIMPSIKPRYYSISSSPYDKQYIDITVKVVKYENRSQIKEGLCSSYISRLQSTNFVYLFHSPCKTSFHLPEDITIPVIMIAAGTGIAPFRGFLRSISAQRKQEANFGEVVLFYGSRSKEACAYYQEFTSMKSAGDITHLFFAFSRDPSSQKQYVQNVIEQQADLVWDLINKGAHIYVCGDGKHMACNVNQTFVDIIQNKGGLEKTQANAYVTKLIENELYVEDVWGN